MNFASADLLVFNTLHNLSGHSALLDSLIVFFAQYLIYICVLAVVIVLALAWHKGNRMHAYGYVCAFLAALVARFGIASGIRMFYHRARPFVELGTSHLINDSAYSFPSGHTIFMFALATAIVPFNRTLGWLLCAAGLLIGISRVAAGVHYPSDIVGGMILGVLTGAIITYFFRKKKNAPSSSLKRDA